MHEYLTPEIIPAGDLYVARGLGILATDPAKSSASGGPGNLDHQYIRFSVEDLKHRVDAFRSRPQNELSDTQLRDGVYAILLGEKSQSITFLRTKIEIAAGSNLFRARWIEDKDKQLRTTSDIWEPKAEHVSRAGRLNSSGESILYTSLASPRTALAECRFEVGDVFAMSRFEAKDLLSAIVVGFAPLMPGLSEENGRKLQVIQDFLDESFSSKAGRDDPEPYRLSRLLALEFWDMPKQMSSGWAFRSTVDPTGSGWNISFRPARGRQSLRYKETHLYELLDYDETTGTPKVKLLGAYQPGPRERLRRLTDERVGSLTHWF
ncbi:RES domain-containing protein [Paenarthrobacter nitroguajacolicus]|uniref:RES domain-containing protein n=1 Tax=Paenarthrobacter nitroguajacolicus TaxID=211146 RepID=UPI00285A150B|nr:RES domain-containing protein [Paenarthrobacter nitroguajacolicus]MDR6637516.1 hypothetical protein [Paenarthrobacter nitroguajacolicus]